MRQKNNQNIIILLIAAIMLIAIFVAYCDEITKESPCDKSIECVEP